MQFISAQSAYQGQGNMAVRVCLQQISSAIAHVMHTSGSEKPFMASSRPKWAETGTLMLVTCRKHSAHRSAEPGTLTYDDTAHQATLPSERTVQTRGSGVP